MKKLAVVFLAGALTLGTVSFALAAAPTTDPAVAAAMEQKAQDLRAAHWAKIAPLHNKLAAKHMELEAIKGLNGTTKEDVRALVDEIFTLKDELYKEQEAFRAIMVKEKLEDYAFGGRGNMGNCAGMGGMGGMKGDCGMRGDGNGHGKGGMRGDSNGHSNGHDKGGMRGDGHGKGHNMNKSSN